MTEVENIVSSCLDISLSSLILKKQNMNFSRQDFRAVIYFNYKLSRTTQDTHDLMRQAFGKDAPSLATIYSWYAKFQRGQERISDDARKGAPSTAVTEENIEAVREILVHDPGATYVQIQAALGIGVSAVQKILHDHLGVKRRVCTRWISHELMIGNRRDPSRMG